MKQTGIEVRLLGEAASVFSIIRKVVKELNRAGFVDEAKRFRVEAFDKCQGRYTEVLDLAREYVVLL